MIFRAVQSGERSRNTSLTERTATSPRNVTALTRRRMRWPNHNSEDVRPTRYRSPSQLCSDKRPSRFRGIENCDAKRLSVAWVIRERRIQIKACF